MLRAPCFGLLLALLGCSFLAAQEEEKFASGPKVGKPMPAPFEFYNVNGPAKGRHHCLICYFGLNPSVLIFTKEPPADKDEPLNELLRKLDKAVDEFEYRGLSVGVVFLSPDGRDSTNNAGAEKSSEIIKEALDREKLVKRIQDRADKLKLKNVIVGYYLTEGPKGYDLNPKADTTILFYERMKILENWAFPQDALQVKDVDGIVQRVGELLSLRKKTAPEKGKKGAS